MFSERGIKIQQYKLLNKQETETRNGFTSLRPNNIILHLFILIPKLIFREVRRCTGAHYCTLLAVLCLQAVYDQKSDDQLVVKVALQHWKAKGNNKKTQVQTEKPGTRQRSTATNCTAVISSISTGSQTPSQKGKQLRWYRSLLHVNNLRVRV